MTTTTQAHRPAPRRKVLVAVLAVAAALVVTSGAAAAQTEPDGGLSRLKVSTDPYTNPDSMHRTEVEPDTIAFGNTIVSTFQVGRYFDGGASNIGWATSTNGGATWQRGYLPSTTDKATPPGPYDRISDPAVAYDPEHGLWIIGTLGIDENPNDLLVHRSVDGLNWGPPVVVLNGTGSSFHDKNWIVCDSSPSSEFFGNCYVTWDDAGLGQRLLNSVSTDGGLTWSVPRSVSGNASGLGGQPVVQPDGDVIVPYWDNFANRIASYRSLDGGLTWLAPSTVSTVQHHDPAGGLRELPLPTAELDATGTVTVAWSDCRFRPGCPSNDTVFSQSADGVGWTAPVRVPADPTTSTVDHFLSGIAVDPATSGATTRLSLAYFAYPVASCTTSTCVLQVYGTHSDNNGVTWSAPVKLNQRDMPLAWVPNTTNGRMVGDYISTSFVGAAAYTVVPLSQAPEGSTFRQFMFAISGF